MNQATANYQLLRQALKATEKTVNITIASDDLTKLKKADYRLCFAKKINDTYNVVWESRPTQQYLVNNTFSWTPQYQIFGSKVFEDTVKVEVSTNQVDIGLGQQVTMDKVGNLSQAIDFTTDPATYFKFINEFGPIHVGVCQYHKGGLTPIYVSENPIVSGDDVLAPKEMVQIWFQTDIETSTMFSTARSQTIEVDLTNTDERSIEYKDEAWKNI